MEINTEYLDLKINGVEHKLELLTFKQTEDILKKIESIDKGSPTEVLKLKAGVLTDSGLPQKQLEKLQMTHVNNIFDEIIGAGKN